MAGDYKILISGEWRTTGKVLEVVSPFDGEVVAKTYIAGPTEIEEAVAGASAVASKLRNMPAYERAAMIAKVADGLSERSEEVARAISKEAGKPIKDARLEVARSCNTFRIASEEARRQGGEMIPLDTFPGSENRMGLTKRFPVGVVLGISPFNFPLNLVSHKVGPAMACGCPIIIKPASKTPVTALLLARIVMDAGWPAGGLSVIPSSGADIEPLMDDERIKKLTFTGSPAVGWKLKNKAGPMKVTLELGGNAGVIVCEDADVKLAAARCTVGAFSFSGQICISVQRIYVQRALFDAFKEEFIKNVAALKVGDPMLEDTAVGPMIDPGEAKRTAAWVDEAVEDGAVLLAGGRAEGGCFLPTVLTGTKPSMKVCGDEVFAPVTTLEPFDTFDEAIELVNTSLYGLQAGLFTSDMKRIFKAYDEIDVGGLVANDIPTYRVDNMPYGGVKRSGFGREGVRYAIEEMTEMKLLALNLS